MENIKNKLSYIENFSKYIQKYTSKSYEELYTMVKHLPIKKIDKGVTLLRQGDIVNKCYFILEGCIRKYYVDESGNEITADFYLEYQNVAIFKSDENGRSPYYLTSLEETVVIEGDLNSIEEETRKYPLFSEIMQKIVEENIGDLNAHITTFIGLNAEDRVKQMLRKKPELFKRVSQYHLASYLGITPESLSRIKKRLEAS